MKNDCLMKLQGSQLLSNSWKQELQIKDDGVYGESLVLGSRRKMYLPYENIAQVNVVRGVFSSDIEVINKGGAGNLIVKALKKPEAEAARELIEQKRVEAQKSGKSETNEKDATHQLKKWAELRDQNLITQKEFDSKKKQLLGL